MTGLFGSLNTATGGMNAQQNALQTTSHNLSNINTPGYSRQRVTMKTAFPQSKPGVGQMGMGVQISGITRVTDEYVTRQLENEMSSFVEQGNISEVLGQLEAVFNEPSDSSVSHQMSEFFASWGSLSENPSLEAGKKLVISQSQTFTDTINHIAEKIDSLATDTVGQIKKDVLDFNATAKQLKKVNEQIFNAKTNGYEPNDLMDTQDQLIGELKVIADVDIQKDQYGRASVSFGKDQPIVDNEGVTEISASTKGAIHYGPKAESDDEPQGDIITLERGSIKGFREAHANIKKKEEQLSKFANDFAKAVNDISEDKGENIFFVSKDGGDITAKNIKVDQKLIENPSSLITGYDNGTGNIAAGDGSRAKAIAKLQNSSGLIDDYNSIITDMGIIKQQADNTMDNQADLVALLDQRKESISGVDMNEEVVNMIQQQSAFQANARMINTINEMLDTLINRTGV